MSPVVAGVDIGGSATKACLLADGEIVSSVVVPTSLQGGEDLGELALFAVAEVVAGVGHGVDGLDAIGIGIPGQVWEGTVRNAANLGIGEEGYDLAAYVTTATGLHAAVENDTTMAAFGAFARLANLDHQLRNLVYIGLGTGVSAGLVLDGRVYRGARGLAGEFGHVPMGTGIECVCGATGCLETVVGATALRGAGGSPSDDSVFAAAASGDARAGEAVERAVGYLAEAMWWLAATYDPDVFVIGGGVGVNNPSIGQAIAERWAAMAQNSHLARRVLDPDRVRVSDLEEPVGAYGAALLAAGSGSDRGRQYPAHTGRRDESND